MTEELSHLEARLDELGRAVAELSERLEAVEAELCGSQPAATRRPGPPPEEPRAPAAAPASSPGICADSSLVPAPLRMLALAGRTLMALGGAYLLRALTEGGHLPREPGIALGFLYALAWIGLAELAARSGRRRSAAFHGTAAALIAYPLTWEAVVRFRIAGPEAGALLLAGFAALLLAGAWRHRLPAVAWLGAGGAVLAAWALAAALAAWLAYAAVVVAVGVATWWLEVAHRWRALAWTAALVADLTVLIALVLAPREGAADWAVAALGVALLGGYVGSFLVRLHGAQHPPGLRFPALQTALALLAGYLPVVVVLRGDGAVAATLGAVSLIAGVACYAAVLLGSGVPGMALRRGRFEAGVALALVLAGTALLLAPTPLALTLAAAAVGGALLERRRGDVGLALHAAVYAVAAAATSGLLAAAVHALAVPAGIAWPELAPAGLAVVLGAAGAFVVLRGDPRGGGGRGALPRLLLLALLALLATAGAVRGLSPLLAGGLGAGAAAGPLAALRTAALAAAAVILAALGRVRGWREASWMVTPLLVLGAIKLVGEDFPRCGPGTLFVALALYGAALIAVARLGRQDRRPADAAAPADEG